MRVREREGEGEEVQECVGIHVSMELEDCGL